MGRRKIEIKKIENKNYLKATFSKRRKGLFRKAGDLCCLCGSEVVVIAYSPGNKPYVFGHPDPDSVLERFLGEQVSSCNDDDDDSSCNDDEEDSDDEDLEGNLMEEEEEQEEEVAYDYDIDEEKLNLWLDEPGNKIIEDLEVNELKIYRAFLRGFRKRVDCKLDEMKWRESCTKDLLGMNYLKNDSEIGSSAASPLLQ